MDGSDLDKRARILAWIRETKAELRRLGVSDDELGRCRSVGDLEVVHGRTLNELMQRRESHASARGAK